ncbi:3-dehydroquinate synthase [Alkalilimnicola sp. S0819]|uniref:3-dehydroquinate synthase n=1 Tax=Alkalilimnicola sp. S0819 TaxID=2613922 RepID=UPI0012627686|nr:3-dehydroquinate synthase [Alkalilimnicola sp. S0819]KAB7624484.1 3-dehydroquinate synthase [Alkalilimnicola sp. S0819]MPQ16235.1 3-dehydroquinate synthase [Alkalilimnicola sp. S0819]
MQTLIVELAERSYPIHIGPGLLDRPELIRPHVHGSQVLIISNETVAPLYLARLQDSLADYRPGTLILPDGERYKTLETAGRIYDELLQGRYDRHCTLIALGGGVIGDMVGFAAATYQRGVHFIQIPTTLLAQVDSSVGGKTAVNHPLGKNMIGAFHQPQLVLADTDTLATLPPRELRAGLAEVVKYGLIRDLPFLEWLEARPQALLAGDGDTLIDAVYASCRNKAEVVAADEREQGQRALLNLGHTFGHAVETHTGYSSWLHGEAVSAGMAMAARLSAELGWLATEDRQRVEALLRALELPTAPPTDLDPQRFRDLMAVDKKAQAGQLRLVLLRALGDAVISRDFDDTALQRTLNHYHRAA